MFDTLRTLLAYVVDLGVLVFFHELGHYLAARSQGVVVEAFSIGFGPALLAWKSPRTGTVWKLSALPLGGYVKMQGWGEPPDGAAPPAPGSFAAASLGAKALIVAAGPVANFILAFVLFAGLCMTVGQVIVQPVISQVMPDSPAAMAHLQAGDRVLAVNRGKISNFGQLQDIIQAHPDATLTFTVSRHGQVLDQKVQLGEVLEEGARIGHLGVIGEEGAVKHYGPLAAIAAGARETVGDASNMLGGLYRLVTEGQGVRQLAGPLGIAQITGKVAALGLVSVINLIALLSINLGIVNLIPIPILDGGHLLFYGAEAVLRRKLPPQAQDFGMRIGLALIFSLILVTTFNDLSRMGAVSWVTHVLG